MEYLDLGMALAVISVPIAIYYMLIVDGFISNQITKWWNGEKYDSDLIPLEVLGMTLICALTFLLTTVGYPIIIGVAIFIKVVVSLRNKRLARINKKKEN